MKEMRIENLSVEFGDERNRVRAVDDVSFTIAPGECFGLVGESGCGKSTILRVLAGLNPDYGGTVSLGGQPVPPKRDKSYFKQVQMVFQDPYGSLHPRKTVFSQVSGPILIHELDRAEQRVDEALAAVGLGPSFRFRYPHQLSGGQRQRVAIARALVLEPEVLLLDEPTSALDVSVQAEILNLLADLREEKRLTYLLVSHDLAVITHLCERLAVMDQGRVVEHLAREQLVRSETEHPSTRRLLEATEELGEDPATPSETVSSRNGARA